MNGRTIETQNSNGSITRTGPGHIPANRIEIDMAVGVADFKFSKTFALISNIIKRKRSLGILARGIHFKADAHVGSPNIRLRLRADYPKTAGGKKVELLRRTVVEAGEAVESLLLGVSQK